MRRRIAFLALLVAFLALPAWAGCPCPDEKSKPKKQHVEKVPPADDADFYKRNGICEPKADVYLGPTFIFADDPSLALGLAVVPRHQEYPWMFTLDAGFLKIEGQDYNVPFRNQYHEFTIPFTADDRTRGIVIVGFKFKLN